MLIPRKSAPYLFSIVLFASVQFCLSNSFSVVLAQQNPASSITEEDLKRGVELYQQGDDMGAIATLQRVVKQRKDFITAWHYLGLAYERQGKTKDARKSYEKAVEAGEVMLEDLFSSMHGNKVIETSKQFKPLLLLAAESADKYLSLNPKPSFSKVKEWKMRAEALRESAEFSGSTNQDGSPFRIYKSNEVTTRARILQRSEPSYTEEARQNNVKGVVRLRAIFAHDGKVRSIRVISGLPHGMSEKAVETTRNIKFIPATLNGQPVSQFIQIEYYFDFY